MVKHTWTDEQSEYEWCDMGYDKLLLQADVLREIGQTVDTSVGLAATL